jgi:hypothetical protein
MASQRGWNHWPGSDRAYHAAAEAAVAAEVAVTAEAFYPLQLLPLLTG